MLTRDDIDLLIETFKTRAEADEDIRKLREEFNIKFQDVLTKLDAVYKELKDFRQEQSMHVQMHRDIDDKLAKLQSSINPA